MRFLAEILGRPPHERPLLLIPLGYPAAECRVPAFAMTRKPLGRGDGGGLMRSAPQWGLRWLPWLLGAIAAVMAMRSLLRGGGDLGIYIDVGREMARGTVDIYRDRETVGAFAYPHFAGLPFWAVDGLLSDRWIRIAWCLSLGLATGMIVDDLRRAVALSHGLRPWQWLLCAVLFQRCVAQNLTHGQLSLWVAACTLRGVRPVLESRDSRAGAWLGIATALKLTPGLYLLALPAMARWRAAVAMAVALGIAVLLSAMAVARHGRTPAPSPAVHLCGPGAPLGRRAGSGHQVRSGPEHRGCT